MNTTQLTFKKALLQAAFIQIAASAASIAQAQSFEEDEAALMGLYGDEEMISIATGNSQPISKAPAVATVITSAQIEAMGATDIDEVLETVPGLHVARNSLGYLPIYVFRGIYEQYNPQVLMLINGIPITNLFHGDRGLAWGGMPVNAISRIEIIRGPGSAVYGADAFAGVINIITKNYDDLDGTTVGMRVGSYDTKEAWTSSGFDSDFGRFAFILEALQTDGMDEEISRDAQSTTDFFLGTNASFAPGPVNLARESIDMRVDWQLAKWQARVGYQHRGDVGVGVGAAEALDPHGRYQADRWNADLTYRDAESFEHWDITLQSSYFNTRQESAADLWVYPPGTSFGPGREFPDGLIGNPEVFERRYNISGSAFYSGIERHSLRIGAGWSDHDIYRTREEKNFFLDPATGLPTPLPGIVDVSDTAAVFLLEDNRENSHVYLQDIWNFAQDWELTAGVRYDEYTDFGGTTNPRAALVWSASQNLTVKWLYSRAFRAPAFSESRAINNPVTLGNPNIDPEIITSYEMAFDYQPSTNLQIGLNVFDYTWEDIILFVPTLSSPPSNVAQNVGRQKGRGAELEIEYALNSRVSFTSNYSWVDAEDVRSEVDAPYSPESQFYFASNLLFSESWRLHVYLNWVMDRNRAAGDPRRDVDDYRDVGATLRYAGTYWGAALKVRNLFDSDQREPSLGSGAGVGIPNDLPLADRNVYFELSTNF